MLYSPHLAQLSLFITILRIQNKIWNAYYAALCISFSNHQNVRLGHHPHYDR